MWALSKGWHKLPVLLVKRFRHQSLNYNFGLFLLSGVCAAKWLLSWICLMTNGGNVNWRSVIKFKWGLPWTSWTVALLISTWAQCKCVNHLCGIGHLPWDNCTLDAEPIWVSFSITMRHPWAFPCRMSKLLFHSLFLEFQIFHVSFKGMYRY